jgi:hypothetical protein
MKEMCLPCYGTGQIRCLRCGGTGVESNSSVFGEGCLKCKGTRYERCLLCRGSGFIGGAAAAGTDSRKSGSVEGGLLRLELRG